VRVRRESERWNTKQIVHNFVTQFQFLSSTPIGQLHETKRAAKQFIARSPVISDHLPCEFLYILKLLPPFDMVWVPDSTTIP